MDGVPINYDARYLAGILLFNRGDRFEAHEVWELLWMESALPEKKFYQGLIQAAVGLCHFANGNLRGAAKLYASSRAYMEPLGSPFLGMDTATFWQQMRTCFAPVIENPDADRHVVELDADLVPKIALEPPPDDWPDPAAYVEEEPEE